MQEERKPFKKFCYWMDKVATDNLKKELLSERKKFSLAVKLPCESLKAQIGIVSPEIWNLNCRYDAAPWYYASNYNGKYLVVSDERLPSKYEEMLEVIVNESDFSPDSYPSREEIETLAESSKYKSQVPEGWLAFPPESKSRLADAFKNSVGIDDSIDEIFRFWDAVHSNFIEGKFAVEKNGETIPYTITDTNHTSSCCVELFNIVGREFKVKYVKPCLGAKIMKALEADRYYEVKSVK
ncbi:MAG: hypothetical protein D6734_11075 [Candidatus Schekmanbacteria bacterium]|nr:MAG: hypothetical protein D6734_11075 [Candidatus Schekmanbacteria bacterium]